MQVKPEDKKEPKKGKPKGAPIDEVGREE